MNKYLPVIILFFITLTPFYVFAQSKDNEPELSSDRPSISQSPTVVPRGRVQVEAGLDYQKDHANGELKKDFVYPTALFRIGLLKQVELRVNADYQKEHIEPEDNRVGTVIPDEKGFNNVQVGTKISFNKGKGIIPKIGFIGNFTLPVGNSEFRPPHVAPAGMLLFNNKVSEKLEIQYNAGYRKRKEKEANQGQAFYSIATSLKLSNKLWYSMEFFASKAKHASAHNVLDVALQYKFLPNFQIDAIAGTGLTNETTDFFGGGGITWRIPR